MHLDGASRARETICIKNKLIYELLWLNLITNVKQCNTQTNIDM